jgi:hypothetical protein
VVAVRESLTWNGHGIANPERPDQALFGKRVSLGFFHMSPLFVPVHL